MPRISFSTKIDNPPPRIYDNPLPFVPAQNIIESGVDIDESSYDDLCRYMLDSDGIIQAIDLFAHQKVSFGARSTQSEQAYLLSKVLTF